MSDCFACGAPLAEEANGVHRCTNSNCPGKVFRLCGYCGGVSQALFEDSVECFNQQCRAHQLRLHVCPDCSYPALVKHSEEETACIYRDCPSNAPFVQECAFCGYRSFIRRDGVDLCSKSRCEALFRPMRECAFCNRWMVDQSTDTCQNLDCEHHDETIVQCGVCNEFTYTLDQDRCWNPHCASAERGDGQTQATLAAGEDGLDDCSACGEHTFLAAEGRCLNVRCSLHTEAPTIQALSPGQGLAPPPPAPPPEDPAPAEPPPTEPPREQASPPPRQDAPTVGAAPGFQPPPPVPAATPDPPPRAAPPAPAAPKIPNLAPGETLDIKKAYEVVKEGLFSVNGAESCPLVLVIGTAGAGKTAFLATLGKILRERNPSYYYPYDEVEADPIDYQSLVDLLAGGTAPQGEERTRMLRTLRESIGDLVHQYAEEVFDRFISKGIWCGFTEHDFGQFLVASVMRQRQPVANIVTLETSGENFKQVLKGINDLDYLASSSSPIISVMADMLRQAQGIVILMDPSVPGNDQTYQQFFNHLSRHLHHRVHVQLEEEITRRLERGGLSKGQLSGREEKMGSQDKGELKRDVESAKDELAFLEGLLDIHGALAVKDEEKRFQNVLDAVETVSPGVKARFQAAIDDHDRNPTATVKAWTQVLAKARENIGPFTKELFALFMPSGLNRKVTYEELFARQICFARGVPPETASEFALAKGPPRRPEQFANLRDLALVFSKADMHPVVHPPDDYPRLKLPATAGALKKTNHYITFLGGTVRYYNASVLGYSCFANGRHRPGIEASITPVNVIEPVFDMLADQLR